MSITSMGGRLITVYRRTVLVVDAGTVDPPATVALDRQPGANAHIEIVAEAATTFGTMTINGDVAGVPTVEVLTFTGNDLLPFSHRLK